MSFPRLTWLVLPLVLGLPLLTGACGAPLAVTAASYGADGTSMVETGKTGTDHFVSMVSKKDCAIWRVFRNQTMCRPLDGDQNPYNVDYNAPFRQGGEGGVEYMPPPHAAANAPAASWDASAYNAAPPSSPAATATVNQMAPTPVLAPTPMQAVALTADTPPTSAAASPPTPAKARKKHGTGRSAVRHKPPKKKPAQDPAATVP